MKLKYALLLSAISLTLTACGGSSNDNPKPPPVVDDITPDSFTFIPHMNVETKVWHESNIESVVGIDNSVPIVINNGEYRINGGDYTSETGTINNGDTLQIRAKEEQFYTVKRAKVTVGNYQAEFRISTNKQNITPKPFTFISQDEAPANQWVESNTIIIEKTLKKTEWFYDVPITIEGGEYRINGGEYTSQPGVINDRDKLQLRVISEQYDSNKTAEVTVGDYSTSFIVATRSAPDTNPNTLQFSPLVNVDVKVWHESNIETVSGINIPVSVAVTDGEYRINGGYYTSETGTINNGDKLQIRAKEEQFYTVKRAKVTVGNYQTEFRISTHKQNITPKPFAFTSQEEVPANQWVESNIVIVEETPEKTARFYEVPITIEGGEYRINGGEYTSQRGVINDRDKLQLRVIADQNDTSKTAVVTIGDYSTSFVVSIAPDTTPDDFSFTEKREQQVNSWVESDVVTITGLNVPARVNIFHNDYPSSVGMSIDGKEYGRTATINNNQTLRVRLKPLDYGGYKLVLNIGGKRADFVVSTITEGNDSVPEQFNFKPKTNQPVNEWIKSDEIVITGLDTKSKILSISDGAAVSVDGSIFYDSDELSAANLKVFNGSRVTVMTKLSNLFRNKTVSLNIGGVTGYFDVTAKPLDKQVLTIGRNGTQKALYTHTVASSAESKAVSYFSIDSSLEDNQRHFVYNDKLYYYDSAAGGINSYDFNTGEIKQLISSSGLKSFDGIYNNKLIYNWGYSTSLSYPWEDTAYYAKMYAIDLLGGAHNLIHDTVYNYSSAGLGDTSETLYMNSNIVLFGQSYYDSFAALTAYRYVLKSLDGDVLFETEKDSVLDINNIKELISAYGETASYFSIDARNCFYKVYLDASSVNEHCYDDFYIDSLFLLDEQLFLRGRYNSSSELGIYKLSEDHESLSLITEHQAGDIKVYSVAKGKLFFIINQSLYQFDGQTSSVVQENVFSQSATGIKIGATNNQLFLIYYEPESDERTIKAYDINTLSTVVIKAGNSSSSVSFYDNFVLLEGRSDTWISNGTPQGTIKLPHGYSTFVVKDALYLYKEEKIYEFTISETELKEVYSGPIIGLETQEQHLTFMTRDVTGLKFHSIEPASGDINVTTLMSEHGQLFNINKSLVVAYPNKLFQSTTGRYMDCSGITNLAT